MSLIYLPAAECVSLGSTNMTYNLYFSLILFACKCLEHFNGCPKIVLLMSVPTEEEPAVRGRRTLLRTKTIRPHVESTYGSSSSGILHKRPAVRPQENAKGSIWILKKIKNQILESGGGGCWKNKFNGIFWAGRFSLLQMSCSQIHSPLTFLGGIKLTPT